MNDQKGVIPSPFGIKVTYREDATEEQKESFMPTIKEMADGLDRDGEQDWPKFVKSITITKD